MTAWHGFYHVHFDADEGLQFEDIDRASQGEVVRLAQMAETFEHFEERKATYGHHKMKASTSFKGKTVSKKRGEDTTERSFAITSEDFEPKKTSLARKKKETTNQIGPLSVKQNKKNPQLPDPNQQNLLHLDQQQLPAMVDRLNAVFKNKDHQDNTGKKLKAEDLKKLADLASPTIKSLDLSVNKELNAYLKRLEDGIVTIGNKVDLLLNSHESLDKTEKKRDFSADESFVLSAYRDKSMEEIPTRLNKTMCPMHSYDKEIRSVNRGALSDLHSSDKNAHPISIQIQNISPKWPLHANRYFLDPNHRVKVENRKKHPLKWESIAEEKERLSTRRVDPIPVPELVKIKSQQSLLTQKSQGILKPAVRKASNDNISKDTKRKPRARFGEEQTKKIDLKTQRTQQSSRSVITWKEHPIIEKPIQKETAKTVTNIQIKPSLLVQHKNTNGGLQRRRDEALLSRKKLQLVDIPPVNHLPWHKQRVTPVR